MPESSEPRDSEETLKNLSLHIFRYDMDVRILIVEDDLRMADLLRRVLSEEGHQVLGARDGREGFEIAQCSDFDVIVLDVMLPGMDGFTVASRLRAIRNQTPVLMLTARDAPADIVGGLDSGADDYLTKPFTIDVLLARLRAVSRRGEIPRPLLLQVADLRLDPASHTVSRGDKELSLTPREYKLLELLMRNLGRVISRETILESVWGFGTEIAGNTLEVFMRQLRLKIDTQEPKLIRTVRGFGYMLREPSPK
jgi:two-component system OmpR family response regulator